MVGEQVPNLSKKNTHIVTHGLDPGQKTTDAPTALGTPSLIGRSIIIRLLQPIRDASLRTTGEVPPSGETTFDTLPTSLQK